MVPAYSRADLPSVGIKMAFTAFDGAHLFSSTPTFFQLDADVFSSTRTFKN
jgi:hypothetical protein